MQNPTGTMGHTRSGHAHPLAGARGWIISDGKAGHEALCLGVAAALGLSVEIKRIAPSGIWKALAPWGPVSPSERFGAPHTTFAPPWPQIALAAGRTTTPYIRALKKKAGLKTFTVVMMDPKTGPATADLFWVPEHDRRRGPNVIATLTAPHPLSPQRLADVRKTPDAAIDALKAPRVAVLVGGPNERYRYPKPVIDRLADTVRSLVDLGAGLMITVSRRTPPELVAALDDAVQGTNAIFWKGEGPNPYSAFLAHADTFLVTADSVNMVGEAAATGKPIYVFEPQGGADKFTAFHAALRAKGVTREAPDRFETIGEWTYTPLYAADTIAAEIAQRWQRRKSLLSGLT
ncbi:mitochondrial fission ELM1 family protein [Hyphomicrobium sp. LHD-15]|uniref:mitochondrial fission ELM1 family protein n=1 Tax=Hyphomicrobium sp. LHD-15 TaxID=3072142 RepID=UPI00280D5616|nr:mitochondrial fission ELM1 family protein [Hyphomicrobium sp. LHD-15]MDQ8700302.1 mitochondrial fission ELM1 family protein [Hyphomicrobium sp. LHD-15]